MIRDGLDGLIEGIGTLAERGIPLRIEAVHRVVGEGDFVLVQAEGEFGGRRSVIYDIFRLADNRVAEHWDVVAPMPDPATVPHANGLF